MKITPVLLSIIIVLSFSGCAMANVSKSREAFIVSQPHGWISIFFVDPDIPAYVQTDKQGEQKEYIPSLCSLTVKINNERFLYESIFPYGEAPPYSVDTGFRFAAPVGKYQMEIDYYGCDVDNDEITGVSTVINITIVENMVTPIKYNGSLFEIGEIEKNEVVSLDDIYNKISKLTPN